MAVKYTVTENGIHDLSSELDSIKLVVKKSNFIGEVITSELADSIKIQGLGANASFITSSGDDKLSLKSSASVFDLDFGDGNNSLKSKLSENSDLDVSLGAGLNKLSIKSDTSHFDIQSLANNSNVLKISLKNSLEASSIHTGAGEQNVKVKLDNSDLVYSSTDFANELSSYNLNINAKNKVLHGFAGVTLQLK